MLQMREGFREDETLRSTSSKSKIWCLIDLNRTVSLGGEVCYLKRRPRGKSNLESAEWRESFDQSKALGDSQKSNLKGDPWMQRKARFEIF